MLARVFLRNLHGVVVSHFVSALEFFARTIATSPSSRQATGRVSLTNFCSISRAPMRRCCDTSRAQAFSSALKIETGGRNHLKIKHYLRRSTLTRSTDRREPSEAPCQTEAEISEIEAAVSSWQAGSEQREPLSQDTTKKATNKQSQDKTELEKAKEVAEALRLVEQALRKAEDKLEDIPNLPSARLRREVSGTTMNLCSDVCRQAFCLLQNSTLWHLHARALVCQQVPEWLWSVISIARLSAVLAAAIYAHSCGPVLQIISSVGAGTALGFLGYRKGSLSASGAVPAWTIQKRSPFIVDIILPLPDQ